MDRTRSLQERLDAVERAITERETSVADVEDAAAFTARIEDVESDLDALRAQVDEIEAGVAAVRGYVGEIRHVNEEVERTATAAVAAVERLDDASGTPPPIARVAEERTVPEALPPEEPSGDGDRTLLDRLGAML